MQTPAPCCSPAAFPPCPPPPLPARSQMSNKEKKALAKLRQARKDRGEVVTESEDEA